MVEHVDQIVSAVWTHNSATLVTVVTPANRVTVVTVVDKANRVTVVTVVDKANRVTIETIAAPRNRKLNTATPPLALNYLTKKTAELAIAVVTMVTVIATI